MKPILIVEDDEHIAKMIAATLSIGGYTSEICEDGERAVTLISERDYDLSLIHISVYFEGRFYALLPDYSNLFHICKELGNGGSTIILAYGIVLGTVGLGLLMPTILHREPKERVVST